MCLLKPLKIKKIADDNILLENGIRAYYDKKIGKIKIGDSVLVYGNLILEKINDQKQRQ